MNYYEEEFNKIAEDFNLEKYGFSCTLPGIHPNDYIMKYNYRNRKIYCARQICNFKSAGGSYLCCFHSEELEPKQARARVAELVKQYKQLQIQKKLDSIKKDFV